VLDPVDLREHLFHRQGDEVFDFDRTRAGKADEHVCEGHVDLRLLLAWCHYHREHAEQHCRQRKQWRQGVVLETRGEATRDAEPSLHRSLLPVT
jgi:hypothetical protein